VARRRRPERRSATSVGA